MPSGHMGWFVKCKPFGTSVLLYESGTLNVICCTHVLFLFFYENVQNVMLIHTSAVLYCTAMLAEPDL